MYVGCSRLGTGTKDLWHVRTLLVVNRVLSSCVLCGAKYELGLEDYREENIFIAPATGSQTFCLHDKKKTFFSYLMLQLRLN